MSAYVNVYDYGQNSWYSPQSSTVTKETVTVKEYDDEGKVVKETTTVTEKTTYHSSYPQPFRPYWQADTGGSAGSSSQAIN